MSVVLIDPRSTVDTLPPDVASRTAAPTALSGAAAGRVSTVERAPVPPSRPADRLVELLLAARDGDDVAFAELYRHTCSRVFGMTLRVLRSRELAAEVTQEVYVEVWRQAARFEPQRGSVLAWMTTMAHRRAVDRVRSVSTATAREERWAWQSWSPDVDDVWEQAGRVLEAARVRSALGVLTPLQRATIQAVYLDGRAPADLAAEYGVPVGTVKTRLRDGLRRLRAALS